MASSSSSTPPPSRPPAAPAPASSPSPPPPPPPANAASASASSSSYPSSSSTRIVQLKKYGVFLSFRGADVRDNFVSHLYHALCLQGILTFLDNEELDRGKPISEILEAISESNIAIVVFSENYAASSFCLDELVKIMECKENQGLVVLPIFYKVDPDDLASQTGCFGKAFVKHMHAMNEEGGSRVMRWRNAMIEAANLSGWDSRNIRLESTLIAEIVKDISRKLGYRCLNSFKGLVGMKSRIERVEYLLSFHSNDTRVVGIWGMGGVGKTTLAKCVFDRNIMYFQGSSCFLSGVREESQRRGLQELRYDLLGNVFGNRNATMNQLRHRKIFIVLDDVDSYKQFESLIGGPDWIAEGSKIIITSRDKNLLDNVVDIGCMFKVPYLVDQEALQLFISFAFRGISPVNDYIKLSNTVVSYAKGNPLALKVLGLFLLNKSKQEWESTQEKLKRTMNKDILEVLRISYDGLDDEEKEIFLHISCFLRGKLESHVREILDACSFGASIGLRVLIDKALIERWNNKIEMHDLLQEMGQEIVRQECVNDPGKRSRLWNHNDVNRLFTENSGTGMIKGLFLNVSAISRLALAPKAFANMDRIELLKFYGYVDRYDKYFPQRLESQFKVIQLTQGLKSLPSSLRYLYWECYPLKSLPSKFHAENLAIIDIPCSNVERLWIGEQNLVNLKVIKLHRCRNLIEMPNLSSAHNLVTIDCTDCESLLEVPPSISFLEKLEELVLRFCAKIKSVPSTKRAMSLKTLDFHYCSALSTFPEVSPNVKTLRLAGTAIEEVPESIKSLAQLEHLDLICKRLGNLPAAVCELKSLTFLSIGPNINVENLNTTLSSLPLLTKLTLFGDSLDALPTSITQLSRLQWLLLPRCKRLRSLPNLPPCLSVIHAIGCTSLETVPRLSFQIAEDWEWDPRYHFSFAHGPRLDHNSRGNILKHGQQAILHLANAVNRHPDLKRLRRRDEVLAICPGSEIPQWFTAQKSGSVINIDLPSGCHNGNFLGFSLCAVIDQQPRENDDGSHKLRIRWKCQFGSNRGASREAYETFNPPLWNLDSRHVFMFYSSYFHRIVTTDSWNQWSGNYYSKASFEVFAEDYCERSCYRVKSCAVRILYTSDSDEDHDHSVV